MKPKNSKKSGKSGPLELQKTVGLTPIKKSKKQKIAQQRRELAKSQHFPVYNEKPYFDSMPVHHFQPQPQTRNFNQPQHHFQPQPQHQSQALYPPQNQPQN